MKIKQKIFVSVMLILGVLNIPGIPAPVRMTFYGMLLTASTAASATIFYFFSNIPVTKYSLLVSSSKSVIVWHSCMAGMFCLFNVRFALINSLE